MRTIAAALALGTVLTAPALAQPSGADAARRAMVEVVEAKAERTARVTDVATIDDAVLAALRAVPRHRFVPERVRAYAYAPTPLPVSEEHRLASPFLVALMTQLARVEAGDRVFETGTGAGYHAAVLARMGAEVVSVEVVPSAATRAREILAAVGAANVSVHIADGYYGWPRAAPYDAILVKEAVGNVPPALLDQLKPGGRLVAPIGPPGGEQHLTVLTRERTGVRRRRVMPVRFAPLQGGERI